MLSYSTENGFVAKGKILQFLNPFGWTGAPKAADTMSLKWLDELKI